MRRCDLLSFWLTREHRLHQLALKVQTHHERHRFSSNRRHRAVDPGRQLAHSAVVLLVDIPTVLAAPGRHHDRPEDRPGLTMLDWQQEQSKELRRDLRPLVWTAAAWMAAGPGVAAGVWWGFTAWDKGKEFYDYVERRDAAASNPRPPIRWQNLHRDWTRFGR